MPGLNRDSKCFMSSPIVQPTEVRHPCLFSFSANRTRSLMTLLTRPCAVLRSLMRLRFLRAFFAASRSGANRSKRDRISLRSALTAVTAFLRWLALSCFFRFLQVLQVNEGLPQLLNFSSGFTSPQTLHFLLRTPSTTRMFLSLYSCHETGQRFRWYVVLKYALFLS